ncbi:MAG: DUF3987 domain-containing protein [Thermoleophilia bacterium]
MKASMNKLQSAPNGYKRTLLVNSQELAYSLGSLSPETLVIAVEPERLSTSMEDPLGHYRESVIKLCGDGLPVICPSDLIEDCKGDKQFPRLRAELGARLTSIPLTLPDLEKKPESVSVILDAAIKRQTADDVKANRLIAEQIAEDRQAEREDQEEAGPPVLPFIDIEAVLPASGWLASYFDLMTGATDAPKIFAIISGLCALAIAAGNRVWIGEGSRRIYPNLYAVILSPSGDGRKSTSVDPVHRIFRSDCWKNDFLLPRDTSVQSMHRDLVEMPERAIVASEFKATLDTFSQKYNEGGLSTLTTLFDENEIEISRVQEAKKRAEKVALTILGASTTEWLLEALRPDDYKAGLWVRFLFCLAHRTEFFPEPKYIENELSVLAESLSDVRENLTGAQADFSAVKNESEKFAFYAEGLRRELGQDLKGSLLTGAAARLGTYAKKLALLYSLADGGPGAIRPQPEHWNMAEALLRFLFDCSRYVVDVELCYSRVERQRKELMRVIQSNPGITTSALTRKSQNLKSGERTQLLNDLEQMKFIKRKSYRTKGRPAEKFYPWTFRTG